MIWSTTINTSVSRKDQNLQELSRRYDWPVVEYDEGLTASQAILRRLNVDSLRTEHWLPIAWSPEHAEVLVCDPDDTALTEHIRQVLGVQTLSFRVSTPTELVRLIENSADLNVDFPVFAGRTPLAKVRTYLAGQRTRYAAQRTQFARSRTGLALARTGLTFITIAVAFLRLFGGGSLLFFELPLLVLGVFAIIDGLLWYLPARQESRRIQPYPPYVVPPDFSALDVEDPGGALTYRRSPVVAGSRELRAHWDALSPVERRRFLANDRTNLAEERTILAYLRVMMAKARTGLAFARTGVAFAGIGIGFVRKFPPGPWSIFDWSLIGIGVLMLLEGFIWYYPGRNAGNQALDAVAKTQGKRGPWDSIFPSLCVLARHGDPIMEANSELARPGVFATTGLALERTTLADTRNVMSRLRTIMARARTGMAFIRTGFSVLTVGAGLFIYFHFAGHVDIVWTVFDISLVLIGLYLIGDGLHWYLPAERVKRQSPYVDVDFEIADADYRLPRNAWTRTRYQQ